MKAALSTPLMAPTLLAGPMPAAARGPPEIPFGRLYEHFQGEVVSVKKLVDAGDLDGVTEFTKNFDQEVRRARQDGKQCSRR